MLQAVWSLVSGKDWVYDLLADLAGQRPHAARSAWALDRFFGKSSFRSSSVRSSKMKYDSTAEAILLRGFGKAARKALLAAALDPGRKSSFGKRSSTCGSGGAPWRFYF